MDVTVGSRWRNKRNGRVCVILAEEVHGTGPAWRYEDEPNGWHYSCLEDFVVWKEWEPIVGRVELVQPCGRRLQPWTRGGYCGRKQFHDGECAEAEQEPTDDPTRLRARVLEVDAEKTAPFKK